MKELNILIIENDKDDIQVYQDSIITINREYEGTFRIVATIKENKEDGLQAINENNWVAAFIDLKLSTGDILKASEGNEIINEIYQKLRYPVFVLTNTPNDVDKKFSTSYFLRISPKDELDHLNVFKEVINISKTGIIEILGGKGKIEKYISKIFWQHINHTLSYWIDQDLDEETLKQIILRFTLSHLHENLFHDEAGNFERHHPSEFYIYPPIHDYLFSGDIIALEENLYVVLTPSCDLVIRNYTEYKKGEAPKRNSETALLVKLKEIKTIEGLAEIENGAALTRKLTEKKKKNQYYFIPPFLELKGYMIDFRDCKTIDIEGIKKNSKAIATISSSYLKDIIANFSYYYSRQGAPDINAEYVNEVLFEKNY